jgi:hypothetical protein
MSSLPQFDKPPVPKPIVTKIEQIDPSVLNQLATFLDTGPSPIGILLDGQYIGQFTNVNFVSTTDQKLTWTVNAGS